MDNNRFIVQVYVGDLSTLYEALSVEASKQTTAEEIVSCIVERLTLNENPGRVYELAEVIGDAYGQECKERSLNASESPVQLMLLWPKARSDKSSYRFYLREKVNDYVWRDSFVMDPQLIKDYFHRFLYQPKDREYPDLCQLPDLNEQTLLANLKDRFAAEHIYTYVGSILIAVNPFKFYPIYNPKYVKLYQNQNKRLGSSLPPHIFAIADTAYLCMLKDRQNQCIVISGESGSGKTESTNFLLHHLTALSQKGSHGSGVEQTILSAGPVLEAFGNARTAHNNNSSRFGKFIQVNYKENGMVHGAVVQKYLLEKSRICRQGRNERNYHVFYYLLEGASEQERIALHLKPPDQYYYLNKTTTTGGSTIDDIDKSYEFSRLKQSMEMVGFTAEKQRRLFAVLSAVLLLGNVEFQPRKSAAYHHDEAVGVRNPEVVQLISELLRVKQETLLQALTAKRARASGETLVINYRLPEAIASRDAMAKCLYGALFDWIVLQVNHALLSKKDTLREHQGNSIGVLDIFGFEDFGLCNSFEQLCINYANEHLQFYFNQHVFKYEQEEYRKEGIRWTNIDFMDNTGCLHLIEGKPNGLLCLLDDQCNFPGATNDTLLQKFNTVHKENRFYQKPQRREPAFIVVHYAGTVKYQAGEMREKNLDLMRQDIVGVLKNSSMAFVRELVGADPVAVFRWAIVRAFFRACFAFQEAGRRQRQDRVDGNRNNVQQRYQRNHHHVPNENIISKQRTTLNRIARNHDIDNLTNNRLSWPQLFTPSPPSSPTNNNRSTTINRTPQQLCPSSGNQQLGAATTPASVNSRFVDAERNHHQRSVAGGRCGSNVGWHMGGGGGAVEGPGGGSYERMLYHSDASSVMQKASQIVMKNKSFRPRERGKKGLKNLQSVKTLAGRTGQAAGQLGKSRNNKPMTVTAQFQQSLHSLMDTLNQANPFFIRCIKSNAQKIPNHFDEDTVQRQLRYTGMLETVRIRQAGFNVRLTYDEFIQLYRILLPKGLLSSQNDVRDFLSTLNLNRDNYQLGSSKVFLRESEKYKLDSKLHQQIMASIVTLQRWFRACLERRRYLRLRNAAITIQATCRMYLVQKYVRCVLWAVVRIQRQWRGLMIRRRLDKLRRGVLFIQARVRGFHVRRKFREMMMLHRNKADRIGMRSVSAVKLHVDVSSSIADEAFISKGSSQDELEMDRLCSADRDRRIADSDESSGYIEDLETSSNKQSLRSTQSLPSVTQTNVHHPSVLPYRFQNIRLENTDKEGVLMDSTIKRRISKAGTASAKTIDLSDIDLMCQSFATVGGPHTPHPSTISHTPPLPLTSAPHSSIDSLVSTGAATSTSNQYTFESHSPSHPAQSSYSGGYHHPHYRKDSSDSDYSAAAPPPPPPAPSGVGVGSVSYMGVQQHGVSLSGYVGSPLHEVEKTLQQMSSMRSHSQMQNQQQQQQQVLLKRNYGLVHQHHRTAEKALQVLGESDDTKPKVPSRGMRRTHVKSLGEEMPDSGPATPSLLPVSAHHSLDKNLRPIAETIHPDLNQDFWIAQTKASTAGGALTSRGMTALSADLKRRNSDPAAATNLAAECPTSSKHDGEMYHIKDTHQFTLSGHRFRKQNRFTKNDKCSCCNKDMDSFTAQGHKCTDCKKFAHITCIQNKKLTPCDHKQPEAHVTSGSKHGGRRKYRKHGNNRNSGGSSSSLDPAKPPVTSKFSLTGMSEFTDSTDQIISDGRELKSMQDFISKKISQIESSDDGKKQSGVDLVFKQALREFKDNLVQIYSTANKNGFETCNVQYKDLITNFEQAMETVCQRENKGDSFPVTMGVNAFRGFMNEFMTSRAEPEKPSKTKRKKEKKRKAEDYISFAGHTFMLTIINIPMACEICSSFFMWPIERGLVCQSCKVTCHKKCYVKSANCTKDSSLNADGNKKLFGASLHSLIVENNTMPAVIEKLLSTIELGLYTEGLYRKSGVSSKVRELKNIMEENPVDINFKDYQIHVLASVFKGFLREMPEPLLTFDCYENFITAANMKDQQDRVSTLYDILRKLPKPNYDLMERLTYHLARVALHEERNRMSAASLAIVFAPCILRTNKIIQAQDSLQDISSQTQCIETIISEKLRKLRNTLDDIDTLDSACQAASKRLSSLRSSKVFSPDELMQASSQSTSVTSSQLDDEENIINDHLQEMEKEKDHLTSTLPNLTHANSDDDMLSTDGDGSTDDISCVGGSDPFTAQQHVAKQHRPKAQIIRSISGGGGVHATGAVLPMSPIKQLKRQLSSDVATTTVNVVDEAAASTTEDAPIMV